MSWHTTNVTSNASKVKNYGGGFCHTTHIMLAEIFKKLLQCFSISRNSLLSPYKTYPHFRE